MRLNGWQRLWIVVAATWLMPVIVFSYELWPTTANVSKDEVYARLKPDYGRRLSDYIATSQSGGTVRIDFSKYVSPDQSGWVPDWVPDNPTLGPGAPQSDANASSTLPSPPPGHTLDTPRRGQYTDADIDKPKATGKGQPLTVVSSEMDIDGHKVQVYEGVSPDEVNQTVRAYTAILRHLLNVKRASFIGMVFALWMVPMIAFYLAGWAIAWVRRGFRQVA